MDKPGGDPLPQPPLRAVLQRKHRNKTRSSGARNHKRHVGLNLPQAANVSITRLIRVARGHHGPVASKLTAGVNHCG